jgi:hypothetical protein
VEKWFSPDNGAGGDGLWAPYLVDRDEAGNVTWPIPWTMNGSFDGEPIGIPVFHFKEQPGAGMFGRSILRGVIPMQDGLDKQSVDLFYVMDQLGWRWPWVNGVTETNTASLKMAIGDVVRLPPDSVMGQLEGQDPRPLTEVMDRQLARMAVRTATPLHALITSGDQPSGESRKMAESATVAAALDRHVYLGNPWEDLARMENRLAHVFGDGVALIDPEAEIDAVWDSPETRDEKLEGESLLIDQELGASRASTLRKRGYDPDEEAKLRAEEQAADPLIGRLITPPGSDTDDEDESEDVVPPAG